MIQYMQEERTATVQSVNLLALDEPTPVFNFEVEDCHTYFVGECCILIHSCVAALSGAEFFLTVAMKDDTIHAGTNVRQRFRA